MPKNEILKSKILAYVVSKRSQWYYICIQFHSKVDPSAANEDLNNLKVLCCKLVMLYFLLLVRNNEN